jgi:hypothetical protein
MHHFSRVALYLSLFTISTWSLEICMFTGLNDFMKTISSDTRDQVVAKERREGREKEASYWMSSLYHL